MEVYTIILNENQLQRILLALGEMSYKNVADICDTVKIQYNQQVLSKEDKQNES